jgi:hypothetical protein
MRLVLTKNEQKTAYSKPLFGEWSETRKLSRYGVRGDENASDIASRSPATNAISPFPESSGPRRFQET